MDLFPETRHRCARGHGFTLVELLVVMAIVGTLIALLLPAVQTAREAARRSACQNNLRQLGLALLTHEEQRQVLPVGCWGCRVEILAPGEPYVPPRAMAWNVFVLPYLEQQPLFDRIDFEQSSYAADNRAAAEVIVPTFLCPSVSNETEFSPNGAWRGAAFTDYGGISGVEGPGHGNTDSDSNSNSPHGLADDSLGVMLYEIPTRLAQITDGTSHTVAIGELLLRRQTDAEWINGHNVFAQYHNAGINVESGFGNELGSVHPGGVMVVYCDGHVDWLEESLDQEVLNAQLTRAGGE